MKKQLFAIVIAASLSGCATRYETLTDCNAAEGRCRQGLFGEGYYTNEPQYQPDDMAGRAALIQRLAAYPCSGHSPCR